MRAFVTKIKDFFKLNTNIPGANFDENKRSLCIPLYQREYKWTDEKIVSLLSDVNHRDKFLGNIILDETDSCYEIVDGQQRITTCYLTLVGLYNYYVNSALEQQSILTLIQPYGEYILKNDSIGDYLRNTQSKLVIQIAEASDVYFQKEDFERAQDTIAGFIASQNDPVSVREFKRKLLDSEILVLINDQHTNTSPIEQIFLDINEKAQLLEVEDIFKGHCFENYTEDFHAALRQTWIDLKKSGRGFTSLGFENLSQYIYLFLLEYDNSSIPEKLYQSGKHYLEGKNMDETSTLLQNMISFGNSVLAFKARLNTADYRFSDICANSHAYRNTPDHEALKTMSLEILTREKSLYQKLPFMVLVDTLNQDLHLKDQLSHPDLRKIITNLYIYACLFTLKSGRKSKQDIDHTIRDALHGDGSQIANTIAAAKNLRQTMVNTFELNPHAKFEELAFVFGIMDHYDALRNWLPKLYSRDNGFNLEHFVVPDLRSAKVKWLGTGQTYVLIELNREFANASKKRTVNYLVMDHTLNESLENFDIVTKIQKIREWYPSHALEIPKHISIVLREIESMPTYAALDQLKATGPDQDAVTQAYSQFLEAYFDDEHQRTLLNTLQTAFIRSFQN